MDQNEEDYVCICIKKCWDGSCYNCTDHNQARVMVWQLWWHIVTSWTVSHVTLSHCFTLHHTLDIHLIIDGPWYFLDTILSLDLGLSLTKMALCRDIIERLFTAYQGSIMFQNNSETLTHSRVLHGCEK